MSYCDRKILTFKLDTVTVATDGEIAELYMPPGYKGHFMGMSFYGTTTTTTSAAVISLGTADNDDTYGSASIAVTVAGAAGVVTVTEATTTSDNATIDAEIPSGGKFFVSSDGGPGAGAGDIFIYIEAWK